MSYDLQIVRQGGIDPERASAALAAAGVELDGDEGFVEREGLVAQFLVAEDEIGVGISGDGETFPELLELVLATAEALDATVLDHQVGGEIDRSNLDDAISAFG